MTEEIKTYGEAICEACEEVFDMASPPEEVQAEADEMFPGLKEDDISIVCDPCHKRIINHPNFSKWYKQWQEENPLN